MLVCAVKHDGRHKARLVAGGHLTDIPLESVYSGVVSLQGLRTIIFLAELNGLQTWATDIGNACLEAKTKEKVYIIAGPEFGEREGHALVVYKALYGLRTSGLRWHERFADCLKDMGFFPSKAEPDIWMRKNGNVYEYIATYVDDLAIAMKDPQSIIDILTNVHNFKPKGTGFMEHHLGCDFFRDADGVLCFAPEKYIEKMLDNYFRMFGEKPREYTSPLEPGDHPELDTSPLLSPEDTSKYQSLIGAMQWAISLGKFDICTAVMTMSSFRVAPREGHLKRVRRIIGFLSKFRYSAIRIRTEEPDYSDVPNPHYDWTYTVYGDVKEDIPTDAPEPLGNSVTLTSYVDANLCHDYLTGRSVTGVLHFANQMPWEWFAKKQASTHSATFGTEHAATRTATEQISQNRNYFRYLGVPINDVTYLFGDNKTTVDSASVPHSKLNKRHTALSYHYVRERIAAGFLRYVWLPGKLNVADVLSKHWSYQQVWPLLQPILYWAGDTVLLFKESSD